MITAVNIFFSILYVQEEELEREKQEQVALLQELEEQKAKLEQMLLEARQEREHLKAAVAQEVSMNRPGSPDSHQDVTPGLITEVCFHLKYILSCPLQFVSTRQFKLAGFHHSQRVSDWLMDICKPAHNDVGLFLLQGFCSSHCQCNNKVGRCLPFMSNCADISASSLQLHYVKSVIPSP